MKTELKPFMSVEEVSDLLGVNSQLIYRLVRSGELPAIRVGRVYRVRQEDFAAYVERQKTARADTGGVCAACGKQYDSMLSLREQCEVCGAAICTDCRTRRGATRCREHAAKE